MWRFVILPRLQRLVPTGTILEIAPGYGRWTHYLRHLCRSLIIVDLSSRCIDACKARFVEASNITYHVNDGRSLDAVPDGTVDVVFSFDSLVHCEEDVIEAYLAQIARKLKPNGVGFVHHSNLFDYRRLVNVYYSLPTRLRIRGMFRRLVSLNMAGWRARSVSAAKFRDYCERANLKCVSQELINWHSGRHLIDTISVFTPPGSMHDRPSQILRNRRFVQQAQSIRQLSRLYT